MHMTPAKPKLRVTPELCEGCRDRDCVRACKQQAIRAGRGFVYVDWERCDGCLACVEMCETGALQARDTLPAVTTAGLARSAGVPTRAAAVRAGRSALDGREPNPLASAAPPDPSEPAWTGADALIVLVVMLGTLFALNVVLGTRLVVLMPTSGRVFARAGGLAVAYALEVGVIWLLARRHGVGVVCALGLTPVARSVKSAAVSTITVIGMLLVTRLLSTAYGIITEVLHWQPVFRWDTDLTRIFGRGWVGLSLTIVLVVFVGPFVEEISFRGVVQSAARQRWGAWVSIAATSLLFALYHFDPWMFAPTFVLGLALGWIAEKRRGLWPPIALHVLYNGITVVAVFWLAAQ